MGERKRAQEKTQEGEKEREYTIENKDTADRRFWTFYVLSRE